MTDPAPSSLGSLPDPADFGLSAAEGMARAEIAHPARRALMTTACAMAGVRESVARDGPLAEREMRPLGDVLPGWLAYRGPDRLDPASGNLQQVVLAMRESVVLRRLGHAPERPTLVLTGPTPEES